MELTILSSDPLALTEKNTVSHLLRKTGQAFRLNYQGVLRATLAGYPRVDRSKRPDLSIMTQGEGRAGSNQGQSNIRSTRDADRELTVRSPEIEAPDTAAVEKRRYPRTRKYGPQKLFVRRGAGEVVEPIVGVLWDFSEGGVGMDMPCSLPVDEVVSLSGELHNPDYSMNIEARARVAYCRRVDRDHYRIGFGFVEVAYKRCDPYPS